MRGTETPLVYVCVCVVLLLIVIHSLGIGCKKPRINNNRCHNNSMPSISSYERPSVLNHCGMQYTSEYTNALDRRKESRKIIDPENDILKLQSLGKSLCDSQQKQDDPLTLDGLIQKDALETTQKQIERSFSIGDEDGPIREGMSTPIDLFERNAMKRQLEKRQDIYGDTSYQLNEADRLSELNL
jgi:hypothetical protein